MKDNNGYSSKSYSCCYCGKSFQSRKSLNSREKTIHKEDISYKCYDCPKSFKRKDYLKTHKLTHEEAMGVSCRFCRKSFKTFRKENFSKHLESCKCKKFHHIAYPCIICDKDFSTQPEHKQHMKNITLTLPKSLWVFTQIL